MHTSRQNAGERVTTDRPSVDVVVPFRGSAQSLAGLVDTLSRLQLRNGDTVTIADNRPAGGEPVKARSSVRILPVPERQSSYYARNRAAERGSGDWLLFIDGDVHPPDDLLDRYFPEPAGERVGVLVGAVNDEEVGDGSAPTARFATLQRSMGQHNTLDLPGWGYAQTANCAIRRAAFEQVDGFNGVLRSGGDADICFRLRECGWTMERRDGAAVVHRNRTTLRKLLRQRARHGAGAEWLACHYPGSFPRARWLGLAKWACFSMVRAAADAVRGRRDEALVHAIEPLSVWAFNIGRLMTNTVRER
jgi:cellulose synthase/poly-beta-1,6-N-acetylglucosamine synthase-like glycosyltransferase